MGYGYIRLSVGGVIPIVRERKDAAGRYRARRPHVGGPRADLLSKDEPMREEPSPETTAEIEDALRTGSTRHLAAKGRANNPTEKERAVDALLKEAGLTSTAED